MDSKPMAVEVGGHSYEEYLAGRDVEHALSRQAWELWKVDRKPPAATGRRAGGELGVMVLEGDKNGSTAIGGNDSGKGVRDGITIREENADWDDREGLWRRYQPVVDKRSETKWLGGDLGNAVFVNLMLEPIVRLNEYTGKVEYRGRVIEDVDITRMRLMAAEVASLQGGEYSPMKEVFRDAAVLVAHHRGYNPAVEALCGLEWDGFPRLESLGDFLIGGEKPLDELGNAVMKLIVMGVVARTLDAGCKFDYMPIIVGKQGAAKGNWLRTLAVVEGAYTASFNIHAHDLMKHEIEVCAGKSVVEIGEQAGWDRQGVESIKRFITMWEAEARKAYAVEAVVRKRTFILVATANTARLDDRTGNRRFPICDWGDAVLDEGRWAGHRDQALAEAVSRYRDGEEAILPREMWGLFEERAEEHIEPTSFESWLVDNRGHSWFSEGRTKEEIYGMFASPRSEEGYEAKGGRAGGVIEGGLYGVGIEMARRTTWTPRVFREAMLACGFEPRRTSRRRNWYRRGE